MIKYNLQKVVSRVKSYNYSTWNLLACGLYIPSGLSCRCFLYEGMIKEVTGSCIKLSNEGNSVFYISPNFGRVMKLRRIRRTKHVEFI
jgi:hypothetical protein